MPHNCLTYPNYELLLSTEEWIQNFCECVLHPKKSGPSKCHWNHLHIDHTLQRSYLRYIHQTFKNANSCIEVQTGPKIPSGAEKIYMKALFVPVYEFRFADCSQRCVVDELSAAALCLEVRAFDFSLTHSLYVVPGHPHSLLGHPEPALAGNHNEAALTQHYPQVRGLVVGCPRFVSAGDCCSAACRPICQLLSAGSFHGAAVPCWVKKCSSGGGRGQSVRITQASH